MLIFPKLLYLTLNTPINLDIKRKTRPILPPPSSYAIAHPNLQALPPRQPNRPSVS